MSLGGGRTQSTTDVRLNGININQSHYGNAVPLVYGQNRVPMILLWYGNFIATPHTTTTSNGGKGGGGGSSNTTFTYSASMVLGLCEGPVIGVGQVWRDKSITSASALGFTFFSGAGGQAVWSYLTTNFPAQAVPYDHTAYYGAANFSMGSSAALPNLTFELTGFLPYAFGTINDAEPSAILIDFCTEANHGAGFNALGTIQGAGALTYQSYCIAMGFFISPFETSQRAAVDFIREILKITNSDAFMSAGILNIVPYADVSVTGNSRTYTPNLMPLFAFTDDDYLPGASGAAGDPVIVDRKPLVATFNTVRVEYCNRANAYNIDIAEATDAQDIALNGVRVMSTLSFHSITTASVARQVAQLILQRQLYILSTFTFSVRADYCLLEPMDLVSITDTALGITSKLVRIIEVKDDQNDQITLVCEDMLVGSATAPLYNWQASQGYAANYNATPPSVGTPLIFTAPPLLLAGGGGGYEMWIAVDQATAGSWGGCDVYMSLDNTSYVMAGTINGPARYGTLTAILASQPDPDTTNTLAVALTNAASTTLQLVSGSAADYTNLRTLIYVDGEIMAYQTATLASAGNYNLTNLRRGQYGSSIGSHAIGTAFARIDAAIFRVSFDPGMIGQTMYFKFAGFNIYGQAHQSLASCTAYPHLMASTNAGQLMPGQLTLVGRGVTVVQNNVFKSASASAWDSDVYSLQSYVNGAFVSFQPAQSNLSFFIGMNSNPIPSSSYTALLYGIECYLNGAFYWYTQAGSVTTGSYNPGDTFSITYDGAFVRFLQNGVQFYQTTAAPNLQLYLASSFFDPQAAAHNLQFGPFAASMPQQFIARGGCGVADTNVVKVGGAANTWDSDVYSINGYKACHVVFKANDAATKFMIALVQTPGQAAPAYATLDYALYCSSGTLIAYELGVNAATLGTYLATDYLAVTYDGATVNYLKNGVALRSVAVAGLTLYLGSCFYSIGAACNSLEFGPTATIPLADTAQIGSFAVTDLIEGFTSGPVAVPANTGAQTIATQSVGALPFDTLISVTITFDSNMSGTSADFYLGISTPALHIKDFFNQVTTGWARGTVQGTLSVAAGLSPVVTLVAQTTSSASLSVSNITIHTESVKK